MASSTTTVAVGVPLGWLRKYAPVSWPYHGPAVLGVRRRVDAGVAVSGLDEALERGLLRVGEHVTGGRVEDHEVVAGEERVREQRGVLGRVDREVVLGPELADRRQRRRGSREWRNAAVLEKTSTLKRAFGSSTAANALIVSVRVTEPPNASRDRARTGA